MCIHTFKVDGLRWIISGNSGAFAGVETLLTILDVPQLCLCKTS